MSTENSPFAWLGLLKWSLSYSDGTKPSDETTVMSDEDRAFLEEVMKEGIIDENERMKTILKEVTSTMEKWKNNAYLEEEAHETEDLLQELRDIVEHIDYARAFCSMKGLPFLLGCANEREAMPQSTRAMCLGIISTLCQHNPPVQKELLELGALRSLSELLFLEDSKAAETDKNGKLRSKIIQAISANVRSHDLAESVFSELEQATSLVETGLGITASSPFPSSLRQRTLFFLRALVTSDSSSRTRVRKFEHSIAWTAKHLLDDSIEHSPEIREIALAMVEQILEQKKSVDCILSHKDAIAALGVKRISFLRSTTGEEKEYAADELHTWERLIVALARATPDLEDAPLLLEGRAPDDTETLAQ